MRRIIAVYGTSGVGKSTLLQLAALRALVKGEPVVLRMCDVDKLIRDGRRRAIVCRTFGVGRIWAANGRPRTKRDIVFCYDSPAWIPKDSVGHAEPFQESVCRPLTIGRSLQHDQIGRHCDAFLCRCRSSQNCSRSAQSWASMPTRCAERVARFGPTFPNLSNVAEVEKAIASRASQAMIECWCRRTRQNEPCDVRRAPSRCDGARIRVVVSASRCSSLRPTLRS
jgi:hypothetical protein